MYISRLSKLKISGSFVLLKHATELACVFLLNRLENLYISDLLCKLDFLYIGKQQ